MGGELYFSDYLIESNLCGHIDTPETFSWAKIDEREESICEPCAEKYLLNPS